MPLRNTVSRRLIVSRLVVLSAIILSLMPLVSTTAYSTEPSNVQITMAVASEGSYLVYFSDVLEEDDDEREGRDDDDENKGKDDDHEDGDDDGKGRDHEKPPKPSEPSEPVAQAQRVTTNEDTSTGIKLEGRDRDGDEISFSIVNDPQHGTLGALDPLTGDVSYEPLHDYYGPDSFTFKVDDGTTDSQPAAVTIDVIAVNDPPVAHEGQVRTREDVPLSLTLSASDPDNDPLTYVISAGPIHGSLTGTPPNLQYKPHIHFDGSDSLTFKVNDGTVDSNEAKLAIIVKPEREDREREKDAFERAFPKITVAIEEPISISNSTQNATMIQDPVNDIQAPNSLFDSPLSIVETVLSNPAIGPASAEATLGAEFVAIDTLGPKLLLPSSPLAVLATSTRGAQVTYSVHAVDDEDGDIATSCSPSSGSFFPVGRVNVLCKATDSAGNTSLKSFIVVVRQAGSEDTGLSSLLATIAAGAAAATYGGFRVIKHKKTG